MKLKLIKVGTSGAIVIPKDIRRVFGYGIGAEFKTEFSKGKIVLTKLKNAQPNPMPSPVQKPVKVPGPVPVDELVLEPIMESIVPRKKVPVEKLEPIEESVDEPMKFVCPFCGDEFYDGDNYWDHYSHCPKNPDAKVKE
jgi:bifunctional DNA-binding transcriptional regulator/antitoxin component of YhaV-PrlF toxin-antitoxin module